jgi:hypothetical protein
MTSSSLTFYPPYLFTLSPTYPTWARLTAADIHLRLTRRPGYTEKDLWFILNHPIRLVRVVGIVTSRWERDDLSLTVLTLDDGSGYGLETVIWKKTDDDDAGKMGGTSSSSSVNLNGVEVGRVVKVKGVVDEYRDVRQVKVSKVQLLADGGGAEVDAWESMCAWKRCLLQPWVVGEVERRRVDRKRRLEGVGMVDFGDAGEAERKTKGKTKGRGSRRPEGWKLGRGEGLGIVDLGEEEGVVVGRKSKGRERSKGWESGNGGGLGVVDFGDVEEVGRKTQGGRRPKGWKPGGGEELGIVDFGEEVVVGRRSKERGQPKRRESGNGEGLGVVDFGDGECEARREFRGRRRSVGYKPPLGAGAPGLDFDLGEDDADSGVQLQLKESKRRKVQRDGNLPATIEMRGKGGGGWGKPPTPGLDFNIDFDIPPSVEFELTESVRTRSSFTGGRGTLPQPSTPATYSLEGLGFSQTPEMSFLSRSPSAPSGPVTDSIFRAQHPCTPATTSLEGLGFSQTPNISFFSLSEQSTKKSNFRGRRRVPCSNQQATTAATTPFLLSGGVEQLVERNAPDSRSCRRNGTQKNREKFTSRTLRAAVLSHLRALDPLSVTSSSLLRNGEIARQVRAIAAAEESRAGEAKVLESALGGFVADGYLLPARPQGRGKAEEYIVVGPSQLRDVIDSVAKRTAKGKKVDAGTVWRKTRERGGVWEKVGKEVIKEIVEGAVGVK